MSLEAETAKLTEAVTLNNKLLSELLKGKKSGAAAGESGAAAGERRGRGRPPANKVPTAEEIRAAFGEYMSADDKKVREERKEHVLAILGEIGVEKVNEIPEEHRAQAMAWVKGLVAGEMPNFMADGGNGEEEGDSLLG